MSTKSQTVYYISTGELNARYTLRRAVRSRDHYSDYYLCNLADDLGRAQAKAKDYFDRCSHGDEQLILEPDEFRGERQGRLSVQDTNRMELVAAGLWPFGADVEKPIVDAKDSRVLWWADMQTDTTLKPVAMAVAAYCAGLALERGLYATRDERKAAYEAKKAASQHVGKIGERIELECTIERIYDFETPYGWSSIITMWAGKNCIVYKGSAYLGKKGEIITLRGGVKKHDVYNDTKQTVLQRPSIISTKAPDINPDTE